MRHEAASGRLPDLLIDRDDRDLLAHVNECHVCQELLFRLARVDRLLRDPALRSANSRARSVLLAMAGAAAVAATAAFAFVGHGAAGPSAQLALRTSAGSVVAKASISRADGENQSVALVAHDLPARETGTYLLWTRTPGSEQTILVGRFMVSREGECRARFNLTGTIHSAAFWITAEGHPAAVVASTGLDTRA